MNQYFVRYTVSGYSSNNSFSTTVDIEIGLLADQTLFNILTAVRKQHNDLAREGTNPAYLGISNDNIVIQVLTKLN